MAYLTNLLIGLDQLANAVIGGWPDESISSHAHRQRHKRGWNIARACINRLFWWQPDHCLGAWQAEQWRRQCPPSMRPAVRAPLRF